MSRSVTTTRKLSGSPVRELDRRSERHPGGPPRARQTREHLFRECITWLEEIRTLWREVGQIGQAGVRRAGGEREDKGRKGFGADYGVGVDQATPL